MTRHLLRRLCISSSRGTCEDWRTRVGGDSPVRLRAVPRLVLYRRIGTPGVSSWLSSLRISLRRWIHLMIRIILAWTDWAKSASYFVTTPSKQMWANHALQRTVAGRRCCIRRASWLQSPVLRGSQHVNCSSRPGVRKTQTNSSNCEGAAPVPALIELPKASVRDPSDRKLLSSLRCRWTAKRRRR